MNNAKFARKVRDLVRASAIEEAAEDKRDKASLSILKDALDLLFPKSNCPAQTSSASELCDGRLAVCVAECKALTLPKYVKVKADVPNNDRRFRHFDIYHYGAEVGSVSFDSYVATGESPWSCDHRGTDLSYDCISTMQEAVDMVLATQAEYRPSRKYGGKNAT